MQMTLLDDVYRLNITIIYVCRYVGEEIRKCYLLRSLNYRQITGLTKPTFYVMYQFKHVNKEQRISLAGQPSPRTPKVLGSIPDLAVSLQFGFMFKMEVPCSLTCPQRTQNITVHYPDCFYSSIRSVMSRRPLAVLFEIENSELCRCVVLVSL